jgi:hypothetical protein
VDEGCSGLTRDFSLFPDFSIGCELILTISKLLGWDKSAVGMLEWDLEKKAVQVEAGKTVF